MKNHKSFSFTLFAILTLVCFQATAVSQTASDKLANMVAGGSSVKLDVLVSNSGSTLTISAPDGRTFRKEFKVGVSPEFSIIDKAGERLPDGIYTYELRIHSSAMPGVLEKARSMRGRDDDSEADRTSRKRLIQANQVQSGSFAIVNGTVIVAGGIEDSRRIAKTASPQPRTKEMAVANMLTRLRHHRMPPVRPDDVIPDDLIVQGSACVGLDCVNGEVFGFDTVRLKENNTRLQFDDTSSSQGFATNNWQIRANDSNSGGSSFLGFVDQGATGNSETGTIVGRFDAGAPANSIRVGSNGKVGFRTAVPVLDLHMNTSDTPAVRFEQNNSGGFSAQTWDIGANEANFFVRDVTGGSRLSFRIRPGAPTSSIDISADGDVGIGTASPNARLDLKQATDDFVGGLHLRRSSTNDTWAIATGADNNLYMGYATDASAANAAADFTIFPLVVTTNNRVGIRTTAPDQALSVNGDASKTGGNTWLAFSDERLKMIKGRFNTGLKAVMQLQPIRYEYLKDNALGLKSEGEHIGFGAQTLEKIIPEAVTKNGDGYLMVNSDPIIWTMLNAIQEQQKEIAQLKAQVRKLQTSRRRAK